MNSGDLWKHPTSPWVYVFGVFVVCLLLFLAYDAWLRRGALRRAANLLGAEVKWLSTTKLTASVRGFAFTFQLESGSKNSPEHTYIHVETPPFDLLLDLTKEGDEIGSRRFNRVDIEIGDAKFDAVWTVEGAPPERIKRLLADEALRARLNNCAYQSNAQIQIEDGSVHFSKRGMDYDNGEVRLDNIKLMLDLADAVIAEDALPSPNASVDDGDYRRAPSPNADRSGERQQIQELKRQRAVRTVSQRRYQLFLAPVVVFGAPLAFFATIGQEAAAMHWVFLALALPITLGLAIATRSIVSAYFAARRTAELPPDYPLLATLAAIAIGSLAFGFGLFGF